MISSSSDEEALKTYCICKSTDVNRFMIGCDSCTDWFHGTCVNITERESHAIKKYFCPRCIEINPTRKIVYKSKYKEGHKSSKDDDRRKRKEGEREERRKRKKEKRREEKRKEKEREERRKEKHREERKRKKEREHERNKMKEELNKKRQEEEAKPKTERHSSTDSHVTASKKREWVEPPAKALRDSSESEEDVWEPPVPKKTKVQQKKKPAYESAKKAAGRNRGRRRARETSSDEEPEDPLQNPGQCFGPNCVRLARVGSKYCTDQCGINLATARIYQTLPDRIREWNLTPSASERRNAKDLEEIRAKQTQVKNRLEQLSVEFQNLENIIAKGKTLSIEENSDDDDEEAGETMVHCVTCGTLVQMNKAIQHMERCYNKIESQTSFASKFKTQIEDHRMFCDYYNPKEETYCKRLKVLCPEHNPDPKIHDNEVCGYPLQKELFSKPTSFCLRPKKTCSWHYCWEKLRRAELDMERVKQWMKVDELLEKERQLKSSMSSRAGVVGLMLHSTFNHDFDGRIQAQRAQLQRKILAQQKVNQKPVR